MRVYFSEKTCQDKNFITMKNKFRLFLPTALLIFNLPSLLLGQSKEINSKTNQAIEKKLNGIQIPEVHFSETPLPDVFMELQRQSRKFDQDSSKKGLNILTFKNGDEPFPNVTIHLNPMPLGKMIQFISEMVGWTYEIEADIVVISKFGRSKKPILETEFFELTQGTINRITGGGTSGNADPFAPKPVTGSKGDNIGSKLMSFLTSAGIPFVSSKGHKFVFDGFQMVITHERDSLDLVEKIIRRFDPDRSKQITINIKVFESEIGKIDQVAKGFNKQNNSNSKTSIIEQPEAEKIIQEMRSSTEFDLLHSPNIVVIEGQVGEISAGEEMVYPTDFQITSTTQTQRTQSVTPRFDTLGPEDEKPGFRHIGLKLTILPKVQKNNFIALEISSKLTRLLGYEEFAPGFRLPKFWSNKVNTSVLIEPDQTLVVRNTSSEPKKEIIMLIHISLQ